MRELCASSSAIEFSEKLFLSVAFFLPGMDEGIGFRYPPNSYALRATLELRSSRRTHPFREERKQQTETAFRKTQLQNLTHTTTRCRAPRGVNVGFNGCSLTARPRLTAFEMTIRLK